MIQSALKSQPRNYVVMQVKSNLIKEEREKLLAFFPSYLYKRVAHVQLGEPPADFKKRTQEVTLKDKQTASDAEHNRKQFEEKRTFLEAKKKREAEKAKKKAEKERAKRVKEIAKKKEADKKEQEKKKAAEDGKADDDKNEDDKEEKKERQAEKEDEEP